MIVEKWRYNECNMCALTGGRCDNPNVENRDFDCRRCNAPILMTLDRILQMRGCKEL